MADVKIKYPATSSETITITLASLSSNSAGVYTSGRQSASVNNTSNLDIDHLVSGKIRTGTSPVSGRLIQVLAYANIGSSSGTPIYPDNITGTDSSLTFTSANIMNVIVRPVAVIVVDSNSNYDYFFGPVSIAALFGHMPKYWGIYVAHDTGTALNSTGSNHVIQYERIQYQSI